MTFYHYVATQQQQPRSYRVLPFKERGNNWNLQECLTEFMVTKVFKNQSTVTVVVSQINLEKDSVPEQIKPEVNMI